MILTKQPTNQPTNQPTKQPTNPIRDLQHVFHLY